MVVCIHGTAANKPVFAVEAWGSWQNITSFWRDVCAAAPGYGMIALRKGDTSNPTTIATFGPRDACPTPYYNAPPPAAWPANWSSLLMNHQVNEVFNYPAHVLTNVSVSRHLHQRSAGWWP
jgi:hypothetical protein